MVLYEVENVKFRYPTGTRDVLDGVGLVLRTGEILSILGPNGSGKSTLLDCMAGLRTPTAGSIRLEGSELSGWRPQDIARIISYVPQTHRPAFSYTVLDFVIMGRAPHMRMFQRPGEEDVLAGRRALGELGIERLADKAYTEISGGELQQAIIARALCQQPKVILFDEPTAHLDYGNQHRILRLIKRLSARGYSIIITTHNPDHALLLGGRAAILDDDGKMVCGSCGELLEERRLRQIYKMDLRIAYAPAVERAACLAPRLEEGAED